MNVLYLGPVEMLPCLQSWLPADATLSHAICDSDVEEALPNCDVILDAYMKIKFASSRLAKASRLKLVVTATTGADHIDAAHLDSRGIPLLTLKGQTEVLRNITSAAEHSWLLLMACARQLRSAIQQPLSGGWDRNCYPGIMLRGKCLGIIGCGRIGGWMARYASAFGMRLIGYDPFIDHLPDGIEAVDLQQLCAEADFVSVHVHLSESTRLLLGAREIGGMKEGSVLINTSRGDIIDEKAVLQGLKDGRIVAVGLDVLTGEPDVNANPLLEYAKDHENVVITPHIGGFCPDALKYVLEFSCSRIAKYLESNHG